MVDSRADALLVTAPAGMIRGVHLKRADVLAFRGIPFAAPPTGERRFRAPRPAEPWAGILDASEFGPVAPQDRLGPFSGASASLERSEDCLTLNVLAPARKAVAENAGAENASAKNAGAENADADGARGATEHPLPVMVYIHGGAYSVGAPADLPDRGSNFARRGVVHVTFNYRLNAFGYLDFSAYGFDNNLGLRDQVAALEWVRDNIAAFGGDPANVTVYGESSGGNAVTTLLATPAAKGLFTRAIAQSPPSNAVYESATTRGWADEFFEILGVPAGGEAEALRSTPAPELVAAARRLFVRVPDTSPGAQAFSPVIDGYYLPAHPLDAFRDGATHPVALLIGTNDREGSVFTGKRTILASTPTRLRGILRSAPEAAAAQLLAEYGYPSARAGLDLAGDFAFWRPAERAAEGHSRTAPTYLYRLDFAPRLMQLIGLDATHGADLLTVFGRTRTPVGRAISLLGGGRALDAVSERMQDHWHRFAVDGSVGPEWPAYDEESRRSLVFDEVDRVETDGRRAKRLAWQRAGW